MHSPWVICSTWFGYAGFIKEFGDNAPNITPRRLFEARGIFVLPLQERVLDQLHLGIGDSICLSPGELARYAPRNPQTHSGTFRLAAIGGIQKPFTLPNLGG